MSKKVKFLREYNKFRKHKEYIVAEKVASYFLDNSFAELVEDNIVSKEPCGDCEDCEDCKGKNKKTPKKEVKPKSKKKKAPKTK
jgi:hypothetical protein